MSGETGEVYRIWHLVGDQLRPGHFLSVPNLAYLLLAFVVFYGPGGYAPLRCATEFWQTKVWQNHLPWIVGIFVRQVVHWMLLGGLVFHTFKADPRLFSG